MATGLAACRIAMGLYIVPTLFAYTHCLSGDRLVAIEIILFSAFGIYALTVGFEGYGEHPVPHWLRPVIFTTGVFLIWPTARLSQIVAVVALVAVMVLEQKREYAAPAEAG